MGGAAEAHHQSFASSEGGDGTDPKRGKGERDSPTIFGFVEKTAFGRWKRGGIRRWGGRGIGESVPFLVHKSSWSSLSDPLPHHLPQGEEGGEGKRDAQNRKKDQRMVPKKWPYFPFPLLRSLLRAEEESPPEKEEGEDGQRALSQKGEETNNRRTHSRGFSFLCLFRPPLGCKKSAAFPCAHEERNSFLLLHKKVLVMCTFRLGKGHHAITK